MARKTRASAPSATKPPAVQPITVRIDPAAAARLRAERRTQVPPIDPGLPSQQDWPSRLRGHSATAVAVAYTMAKGEWERLHIDPDGIAVR